MPIHNQTQTQCLWVVFLQILLRFKLIILWLIDLNVHTNDGLSFIIRWYIGF